MNSASGGQTHYGFTVGIIMFQTRFPRIRGDIGNASTFSFPVLYKVVRGVSPRSMIIDRDRSSLGVFIEAGKALIEEGIKTIVTSCGFLALFHRELCQALPVPVFLLCRPL